MKIITLCGSLKYKNEMMVIAEKMALKGICILTPVYPVLENHEITEEQLLKLKKAHFKRIELSDAILLEDCGEPSIVCIRLILKNLMNWKLIDYAILNTSYVR